MKQMKIKEILYWDRNDFKAVFMCENCKHEFEKFGYADHNYYNNVTPNAICPKCGLNSHKETEEQLTSRVGRVYRI